MAHINVVPINLGKEISWKFTIRNHLSLKNPTSTFTAYETSGSVAKLIAFALNKKGNLHPFRLIDQTQLQERTNLVRSLLKGHWGLNQSYYYNVMRVKTALIVSSEELANPEVFRILEYTRRRNEEIYRLLRVQKIRN